MATNFKQGQFVPKHPEKYVGNVEKIRYMSSWELKFHEFLDNNANVIQWSSEEIPIKYISPLDGKMHTYWPDYFVVFKDKYGNLRKELIEVKPKKQTKAPRKNSKHVLYEQATYARNVAKWQAAQAWCNKYGVFFRIVTEDSIFR